MSVVAPFFGHYPSSTLLQEMSDGTGFSGYESIANNFNYFKHSGALLSTLLPSFFVITVVAHGRSHTGLWTSTHISDLTERLVKGHERIDERRVGAILSTILAGCPDINPLIINYDSTSVIRKTIDAVCKPENQIVAANFNFSTATIWAFSDEQLVESVIESFTAFNSVYLADGHHRAAALLRAKQLGYQKYQDIFFSSIYLETRELEVHSFHRVIDELGISTQHFFDSLAPFFDIAPAAASLEEMFACRRGEFFVFTSTSGSYRLRRLSKETSTDVTYLENVISALYPNTAMRFEGGPLAVPKIEAEVKRALNAAAFFLYPPTMQEIRQVADRGLFMPVKSSWFEPKIQSGLLSRLF